MNEIMMKDNIYEALERSHVYSQLMESNSEGELSDKTIAKIADDKLRGRGFVTGVADRDFNDLNKFYSIAHRQDINLQDKVENIKELFKSMVPYVLEKLILQSDMGFLESMILEVLIIIISKKEQHIKD